ncbi:MULTISPECIES: tRNA1(Val) (adenine(37)-N6)-methyltransferase [Thermodesulfovibrio]|uniref:SAM-dependent methyltransferase n=2 Tax=Thermodesulfovibrio yellowstonii TaxID=28262 RepID=B5YKJ8_THEYD|nr:MULTISPECIES: methyltransferase [Thermodesulfovibrio]ACI20237.1 SAM-dependent methyltransferase [Thermodesulfovibrio yellowstonii DSM 11347]MDI6865647.1 methyltransferase [Thermodesulfovibrio yellowstonii]GLI53469.1 SAM-dependent methyltransferase [Thermodesulfovibrio islandicus]
MDYTVDSIGSIKICQPKEGYRFSVDALILAHFVNLKRVNKAIDIGAGTGIIGIILAKKYSESHITMIEIQSELAKLAQESAKLNNVNNNITITCMDAKDLISSESFLHEFDVVISNPPFRKPGTGRISNQEKKAVARHELSLTVTDIAKISQKLLKHHGRLYIIHLPERFTEIVRIMSKHYLEIKRVRFVHSKKDSPAKMVLIEAVKGGRVALKVEPPLFIYNDDGTYTDEMKKIYEI